ncbi:MAG TPA: peptide ABC transporter substrate-binding protein, partial [Chlamydiales bacterium]|nr:peptide ABC transporter substrate-binding protein [Chlamydiales bacterium]
DPHFNSHYAYLFYPIKNAKAAKRGVVPLDYVGIQALDAMTLQVDLDHPAPYFLELTAHWVYSPLCKENDELHPGWAYYGGENFVCNGPFKLGKWKRNSEIQVVKNQEYWDAEFVHLRRIDISIIENPKAAFELYQRGELDWIGEPLSEIPHETLKKKGLGMADNVFSHPISAVYWYDFNVKMAPFQSTKIRRSLALALNRQQIIDEVLHGQELPASTILPPNLSLSQNADLADGDPEVAKKLFLAGLEELKMAPKDLPKLTITCYEQEIDEALAVHASKQWKEVLGLDVSVKTLKWEQFLEKCLRHDFHIMGTTWYSWFNDPLYSLEHTKYHSDDNSTTQWQHDGYDELLDKATHCIDPRERKRLLREAENIVMEEMPIIPLFYPTFKYMKKEHVNNIFLSHLGQIDFKWAYVNKSK